MAFQNRESSFQGLVEAGIAAVDGIGSVREIVERLTAQLTPRSES